LINWRKRTTLGYIKLAYSSNSIIRDIIPVNFNGLYTEMITCGNLHLNYWQLKGELLVYNNFNSQSDANYTCVK